MTATDVLSEQRPVAESARPARRGVPGARWAPDLAFLVVVASVVLWRALHFASGGGVSGVDWADMLWMGHAYLGHRVGSASITYPPLVPLLVTAAAAVLTPTRAFVVLGALGAVLPGVGVYVALRPLNSRWRVGLVCVLLLIASSSSEQAAWGGLPELIGFALLPCLLVALALAVEQPTTSRVAGFGISLFLLAATSHLVLAEAAVAVVILGALYVSLGGHSARRQMRSAAGWIALAAAPTLVFVPLYLHLVHTLLLGAAVQRSGAMTLGAKFSYLFREDHGFWALVVLLGAASVLLVFGKRPGMALYRAGAALSIASALCALAVADVRFFYLVPLAATMGLALCFASLRLDEHNVANRAFALLAACALVVNFGFVARGSAALFRKQVAFYTHLSAPSGVLRAVQWIAANVAPSATVAATSVSGSPVGWWVDGLAQRRTLTEASSQFLYYPAERRHAQEAAAIFSAGFPSEHCLARARHDGVAYLLVARGWSGYHRAAIASFARRDPGTVVFADPGAVVVSTGLLH